MSKSKEFESLVANLQRKFVPGCDVRQNDKISGRHTKTLREVDVSIRTKIGTENFLIAIECRHHKRKSDVDQIEAFATKLTDIEAQKGIMVSARGFTAAAKRLAESQGIALYRYEDTLKEGWPSGLETCAIVEVWELRPTGAYIKHNDDRVTSIECDEEHSYHDGITGESVPLATLMRLSWDKLSRQEKSNGDQAIEMAISTPEDESVVALGLVFKTFRHKVIRFGRLQFEGLVDDGSNKAKTRGWRMIFPEIELAEKLPPPLGSSLSLKVSSTLVHTEASKTEALLKLILYGCFEITVGTVDVYELPITTPSALSM